MTRRRLRIGFVAVARPAFKGDAEAVSRRASEWLEAEGEALGYELLRAPHRADDAAGATRAAAWVTASDLDYLLILHATFATGDLLAPLLRAHRRVGIWGVPEREGVPGRRPATRPDADPLPLNSLCGLNMTLSYLDHAAIDRPEGATAKWFFGAPGDAALRRRLASTIRALHAHAALEGARVLQIGGTAPDFYGLEERPAFPDVHVATMPLTALFDAMERAPESDVRRRAERWRAQEPLLDAPFDHLLVAARTEIALAVIAEEGRYDALALRCWPEFPERCGGMACAAVGAMADRSIPTACEGDVMGALSMLALQGAADAPSALMDLSDLDVERDRLLLWHCGNAPRSFAAASGARLTTHFNRDGIGVVRDMALAPGPATGFRFLDGGARAVVLSGELGEPSEPSFDGVRGWWHALRWDGTKRTAADVVAQVLDDRLPHHLALVRGEHTEAMHELTVLLGGAVLPARRVRDALRASSTEESTPRGEEVADGA